MKMNLFAVAVLLSAAQQVSAQLTPQLPTIPTVSGGSCESCSLSMCSSAVSLPVGFGTTCSTYQEKLSDVQFNDITTQCQQPFKDYWCTLISQSCHSADAAQLQAKCHSAYQCLLDSTPGASAMGTGILSSICDNSNTATPAADATGLDAADDATGENDSSSASDDNQDSASDAVSTNDSTTATTDLTDSSTTGVPLSVNTASASGQVSEQPAASQTASHTNSPSSSTAGQVASTVSSNGSLSGSIVIGAQNAGHTGANGAVTASVSGAIVAFVAAAAHFL